MISKNVFLLASAFAVLGFTAVSAQAEDAAYDCDAHATAIKEAGGEVDAAQMEEFANHGCDVTNLEAHDHDSDEHGDDMHSDKMHDDVMHGEEHGDDMHEDGHH